MSKLSEIVERFRALFQRQALGIVFMGGNLGLRGHEFECQPVPHLIFVKLISCLKRPKVKKKEALDGPLKILQT